MIRNVILRELNNSQLHFTVLSAASSMMKMVIKKAI